LKNLIANLGVPLTRDQDEIIELLFEIFILLNGIAFLIILTFQTQQNMMSSTEDEFSKNLGY